jgi:hypothetical protein
MVKHKTKYLLSYSLCFFTIAACIGCGDDSGLGKVTGTITIDGRPAPNGSVTFIPVNGEGPTTGTTISNGEYESDAPIGEAKVEIRVSRVVGKKKLYDTPDSPEQEILEEVLPSNYNQETELRLNVNLGLNEKNWVLESKPGTGK